MTSNMFTPRRSVAAGVIALVGLLVGLLTGCSSGHGSGPAAVAASGTTGHSQADPVASSNTAKAVAFHAQMRKLWEDHVAWTRLAIVAFASGSGGFDATAARLLQNQTDIGNAIKPYYGDAAGDKLASLLHDHITIAVEVLKAAKADQSAAFNEANTRWYANANDIADFLAAANPKFWPQDTMRQMMKMHLDQTLLEASDELHGKYAASVGDYDQVVGHILEMSDGLSAGITGAFPTNFA